MTDVSKPTQDGLLHLDEGLIYLRNIVLILLLLRDKICESVRSLLQRSWKPKWHNNAVSIAACGITMIKPLPQPAACGRVARRLSRVEWLVGGKCGTLMKRGCVLVGVAPVPVSYSTLHTIKKALSLWGLRQGGFTAYTWCALAPHAVLWRR